MWQQFANLRLLFAYQHAHPGKKLQFMGQEFGQRDEWSEAKSLDWHLLQYELHGGVKRLVGDLNRLHTEEPALHEVDFEWTGFEWIDCNDGDNSVISFIRRARNHEDFLVVTLNATPVVRGNYRVGVPVGGFYKEILNTDSTNYGGSGVGNLGGLNSEQVTAQDRPHSLLLTLPPLSALIFKPQR